MISVLDSITAKSEKPGVGDVVKNVFRTLLKKDKLERMAVELDGCRSDFNHYILLLLNSKLEQGFANSHSQYQDLASKQSELTSGQKEILEVISFTRSLQERADLEDVSDLERRALRTRDQPLVDDMTGRQIFGGPGRENDEGLMLPDLKSEEPVAIVVTRGDGTSETVNIMVAPEGGHWSHRNRGPDRRIENAAVFRAIAGHSDGPELSMDSYRSLARTVLDTLYFSAIHEREQVIAKAHRETFEWIFKAEHKFTEFLEDKSSSGCYWITGKPGSGKSTLTKFVTSHDRTQQALESWAGDELAIASFFFWHAGTPIQKSHEGLVRTLLRAILGQRLDLIPTAFPSLCRTYFNTGAIDLKMVTFSELVLALDRLLGRTDSQLKVCMFIDGLDEFAGDPQDICRIVNQLAASPRVKMVVSSRPLNDFENSFRKYREIRMQYLTRSDIERVVHDSLREETVLHLLEDRKQEYVIPELAAEITSRSEGVFLWVILVVRSLVSGVHNWDDVEDLRRRLDGLPRSLEELYKHLFKSVPALYHERTSRFLQIFLRSTEVQPHGPMSVLQLHYACATTTLQAAMASPWKSLQAEERGHISRQVDTRLRASTYGLLEIYTPPTDRFSGSSSTDLYVRYLHKSVLDFLRSDEISAFLKSNQTSSLPLDVDMALLASCFQEIKVLPAERAVILDSDRAMINMRNSLSIIMHAECTQRRSFTKELDYLNMILSKCWQEAEKFKPKASNEGWLLHPEETTWSAFAARYLYQSLFPELTLLNATTLDPFITLAALSGCVLFVADKVSTGSHVSADDRTRALGHLTSQFFVEAWKTGNSSARAAAELDFNFVTAIRKLLDQGVDPTAMTVVPLGNSAVLRLLLRGEAKTIGNYHVTGASPWECYLAHVLAVVRPPAGVDSHSEVRTVARAVQYLQIFQGFLLAGVETQRPLMRLGIAHPAMSSVASISTSVEAVLEMLEAAVLDPGARSFTVDLQSGELDHFEAEMRKTRRLVRPRRSTALRRRFLQDLRKQLRAFTEQPNGLLVGFLAGVISVLLASWFIILGRS